MAINDERHQWIQRCVMHRPEAAVEHSVMLWEQLAVQLCPIIGNGAFDVLFARSAHLASTAHPWLAEGDGAAFERWYASLEQHPAEAGAASISLFIIFTDTLTLLIGESLTTAILRSAWGPDVVDTAAKGTET
ncbi:hypothetical protein [Massilia sp. Root351]|jgi:hypothetical protein|uniref:hypothetical protein n=1 Tax=Massilia sp. Root351 TaxID=1736522 RepID=UPI000B135442|nr:hypothetical protein [Massilia sp. Root351]